MVREDGRGVKNAPQLKLPPSFLVGMQDKVASTGETNRESKAKDMSSGEKKTKVSVD